MTIVSYLWGIGFQPSNTSAAHANRLPRYLGHRNSAHYRTIQVLSYCTHVGYVLCKQCGPTFDLFFIFVFFALSPADRICTKQAVYVIEAAFLYFNSA